MRMDFRGLNGWALAAGLLAMVVGAAWAGDQPQWGERWTRNMVSPEAGLPESFKPDSSEHLLWSVPLGDGSYSSPIVAEGKILIGSNNTKPQDPRHQGDRGVMQCLNEKDGSFLWQLVVPRIGGDQYLDWPGIGICSEPTVEDGLAYLMTNRTEVVCLDLDGLADGNDGPYVEEGRHMTPAEDPPMEPGPFDADIVWLCDLRAAVGVYPHDSPHTSILVDGDYLYLNTCNGVDNTHVKIRAPEAPALIVLEKKTGRVVARDREGMAPRTFHSTWSPPAMGEVNGQRLVFFGGPDGVCYAFKALTSPVPDTMQTLECVWRFDCDPSAPKENIHEYSKNVREGPSEIVAMPVFYKKRVYVVAGGDVWWGKRQAWLKCIDPAGTGDVTKTAELWSYSIPRQCFSTPAITNGLVFVGDDSGVVHCVDAETGEGYWTHDVGRAIWSSALAADGKIYMGARSGVMTVFAAEKTLSVLFDTRFPDEINATPTAANGVLYIATRGALYAFR